MTLRKAWKRGYVLSHLARVSLLISKKFTKGGYTLRKSSACTGKGKERRSVEGETSNTVVYTKMNNGVIIVKTNFVLEVCLARASLVPRPFHLQMAWV